MRIFIVFHVIGHNFANILGEAPIEILLLEGFSLCFCNISEVICL